MRVITGTARGMKLETPDGMDVRPTTDKVKEAVFSILQFEIEGRSVLDLFAGSGQLGIEALSRGARCAAFADQSERSVETVKRNLARTRLAERATVLKGDFADCLRRTSGKFDLCFLDPPYSKKLVDAALPLVAPRIEKNGAAVCELAVKDPLPPSPEGFAPPKVYRYGLTVVAVYRKTGD